LLVLLIPYNLYIMSYMLKPPLSMEGELDELFEQAVEVVVQYDRASPSLLQRRLSIGYARAARLMDQLQEAGVIGPPEGSKAREVLIRSSEEVISKMGKPPTPEQEENFEVPANYKVPTDLKLSQADKTPWGEQLSDVIGSSDFKDSKAQYPILLGFDDESKLHISSLAEVENLIITGNPQSKKETWLDTILTTLLLRHSPKELRFILIDQNHYLDLYDGIPHLLTPIISDFDKSVSALRWIIGETDRRMKLFTQVGERSFEAYNRVSKVIPLPSILIINRCEWVDVETTDAMIVLSNSGPRTGIHLFIVANRLSDKTLSPDVKANVPNRAVFTVTSSQDSRLAGVNGAESLKEGEMLYKQENAEPKKLLTVCTLEINVKEVVEAVKQAAKHS
jgi:DNA segregation ATPase FtsK/SpoIIIE-like protein